MAQFFHIHPQNPQVRLIKRTVEILHAGGVIVYPTDSCYAIGCHLGDKHAQERIRRIRKMDDQHNFTLVCRDLSDVSLYARVTNADYRVLRSLTPGPYTFILPATREVPRRLQHPRRKTIGLRVPDHVIAQALLKELGEPLMSSTLIMPGDSLPLNDAEAIRAQLEHHVDIVIDGGNCGLEPTTVVVLRDGIPELVRQGRGDVTAFQAATA